MAREKRTPSPVKRRPFREMEKQHWALLLQTLLIDGFAEHSRWSGKDFVFHGGTSLKLGWGSPRWSEDLDFLIRRDLLADSAKQMKNAVAHAQEQLFRIDAQMQLDLREKQSRRIARYQVVLTKPGVLGKAAVKAEFWGVGQDYLERYSSEPRIIQPPPELFDAKYFVRVRSMIPVATLNAILCDKILAIANRPYLKSRDIFDMWWLQQERGFKRQSGDRTAEQVMFHATAYDVDFEESADERMSPKVNFNSQVELASSLSQRLGQWSETVKAENYLEQATSELYTFLVASIGAANTWDMYWKDKVSEMIDVASETALECSESLNLIIERASENEHFRNRPPAGG